MTTEICIFSLIIWTFSDELIELRISYIKIKNHAVKGDYIRSLRIEDGRASKATKAKAVKFTNIALNIEPIIILPHPIENVKFETR